MSSPDPDTDFSFFAELQTDMSALFLPIVTIGIAIVAMINMNVAGLMFTCVMCLILSMSAWLRARNISRQQSALRSEVLALRHPNPASVQQHKPQPLTFEVSQSLTTTAQFSRVMLPDDANPAGNVHGGTILKMIGHAGWVAASRHFCQRRDHTMDDSQSSSEHSTPRSSADTSGESLFGDSHPTVIMVRLEHMAFQEPVFIGELASLRAEVTYTSPHSCEAKVEVYAEDVISGLRRFTNRAMLWFVSVQMPARRIASLETKPRHFRAIPMPQLDNLSEREQSEGKQRYLRQKQTRLEEGSLSELIRGFELTEWMDRMLQTESFDTERSGPTVATLSKVLLPSDCFGSTMTVDGGFVMKVMDNCAGIVCARWCRSSIVTVGIDAVNFFSPLYNGDLIHCYGRLIFTSKRSLEVMLLTFVERNDKQQVKPKAGTPTLSPKNNPGIAGRLELVCSAFFTFVAIDKVSRKSRDIAQLVPVTETEKLLHTEGEKRYELRKAERRRQKALLQSPKAKIAMPDESGDLAESEMKTDEKQELEPFVQAFYKSRSISEIAVHQDDRRYYPCVVVGPSAVGKGTVLKKLRARFANRFSVAVSHTTRAMRSGDVDGKSYHFVKREYFEEMIGNKGFVEYANVHGNFYGTSHESVRQVAKHRQICLLEIDVQGAKAIKKEYGEKCHYLYITCPGGVETLEKRMRGRASENEDQIRRRLQTAESEFDFLDKNPQFFDHVLINDKLDRAETEVVELFARWYPHIRQYRPTVVCGPSGVGKGTLLQYLRQTFPKTFSISVSHTTRRKRENEIVDKTYHYVDRPSFEAGIEAGDFIEWAEVHGNYYGTSKKALDQFKVNKQIGLLEIDVQGARSIKKLQNTGAFEANFLFITISGGLEKLAPRLRSRGTETEEQVKKRMKTAANEFKFLDADPSFFDCVLANDDLQTAENDIAKQFKQWYPWIGL